MTKIHTVIKFNINIKIITAHTETTQKEHVIINYDIIIVVMIHTHTQYLSYDGQNAWLPWIPLP